MQTLPAAVVRITELDVVSTPDQEVRHVLNAHSQGMTNPQAGQPKSDLPTERQLSHRQSRDLSSNGRHLILQSDVCLIISRWQVFSKIIYTSLINVAGVLKILS